MAGRDRRDGNEKLESPAGDGPVLISVNSYNASGNPLLHNRSPGNDRWVLRIYNNNPNTNTLLRNLNRVTDIKVKFHIRGFVRQ